MKVSSLVHYGLLERDGNAYRNSELALRLAHRIDDNDFNEAVKLAAVTPKLYRALLGEFAGRAVPTALSSILVRNHKIGQKVADEVAIRSAKQSSTLVCTRTESSAVICQSMAMLASTTPHLYKLARGRHSR